MVKTEVFLQVFVPKEYMTKPRDLPSLLHVSQAWGRGCVASTQAQHEEAQHV